MDCPFVWHSQRSQRSFSILLSVKTCLKTSAWDEHQVGASKAVAASLGQVLVR
jgi:hypothetical protein